MIENIFTSAQLIAMSVGEYNESPALRRSAAWTYWDKGPEMFEGQHVTGVIPHDDAAALRFGTWAHYSILEPDYWAEWAAPCTVGNRNAKTWVAHEAECMLDGRIPLLKKEHDQVARVTEAFRRCKRAQRWLETADAVEETIIAESTAGASTKTRIDLRRSRLVADLKTTSDPTPDGFSKSITKYGYWYQASWYLMAEAAVLGCDVRDLTFATIAVEKTEPYRVAIYELGPEWWEPGIAAVQWTLDQLAREREAGKWQSEWNGRPTMLTPPSWFERSVLDRIGGERC